MKILVIGESCTDVFVYCDAKRLSPEAPIPVLNPILTKQNEGMAANVVLNLYSCGADKVDLISNKEPIKKRRYVDQKSNYMLLRVDENDEVNVPFSFEGIQWNDYDAVVVSDYDKGFLSESILQQIPYLHPLSFLDTKKPISAWALKYTFIKINEPEWEKSVKAGAKALDWGNKLIVTKGKQGCDYMGKNYPVESVSMKDVSGAGDTFLAGLVFCYLQEKDIDLAIKYANEVATIVVQKHGVSVPYEA